MHKDVNESNKYSYLFTLLPLEYLVPYQTPKNSQEHSTAPLTAKWTQRKNVRCGEHTCDIKKYLHSGTHLLLLVIYQNCHKH